MFFFGWRIAHLLAAHSEDFLGVAGPILMGLAERYTPPLLVTSWRKADLGSHNSGSGELEEEHRSAGGLQIT